MKKILSVFCITFLTIGFAQPKARAINEAYTPPVTKCIYVTDTETITVRVKCVESFPESKVEPNYTQEDLDELARIVYWEAWGESEEGQIAVAQVVLNRVRSDDFPDTIREVIAQKGQFAPFSSPDYDTVSIPQECFDSAKKALEGQDVVGDSTYWFRSDQCPDTWFGAQLVMTIGGHHFYGLTQV